MTETQIRYFMTVAEELSFSKAAQRLFVSQPAVSKNIALLENELGFMLFDRTAKQIYMTDEAMIFLDYINRSYADFYQTMDGIRQLRTTVHGQIRIGIVDDWNASRFYHEIADYFAQVHPNIHLQVRAYGVDSMLQALQAGEIDIGITYDFMVENRKDIASKPFVSLEVGFLYSDSQAETKTSLADFRDMPFILQKEGAEPISQLIQSFCRPYQFSPTFVYSSGEEQEISDIRHGRAAMFCCDWHIWKKSGMFSCFSTNRHILTKLVYLPGQVGQAKNIFLNEIEMLFEQKESPEQLRKVHGPVTPGK